MIAVPDSVAFYWAEPANMAAINLLIDRTEIPHDLDMDEVEQFETASLSAQRVRLDFWRLLRQLWSATWGEATRAEFPAARLLNYDKHASFATDPITPSIENAWLDRATFGLFAVGARGRLVTRVMFADRTWRDLVLSFYYQGEDETWAISDALDLGLDWSNDGGWRSTSIAVEARNSGGSVETVAAAQATQTALSMLSRSLA